MMNVIPCFSATGKVGKQWIFKPFPPLKRIDVYAYVVPHNPNSPAQQACRQRFADAMAAWKILPAEEKAVYEYRTRLKRMTGKNLFVKEYNAAHPLQSHIVDENNNILSDEQGNRWIP